MRGRDGVRIAACASFLADKDGFLRHAGETALVSGRYARDAIGGPWRSLVIRGRRPPIRWVRSGDSHGITGKMR